jgi:hypothetical protein
MRGCAEAAAVRKGPWTLEEDLVLVSYITEHGEGAWDNLARAAGTVRSIAFFFCSLACVLACGCCTLK